MTNKYSESFESDDDQAGQQNSYDDMEKMIEIGLEDFQPKGTLTITLLYLVIIVVMWLFMYFVEFAGNDPSILN